MTGVMDDLGNDLDRHVGKFYGKYAGLVADVADPSHLGRIRVTVPTIFPETEPVWARPCFPSGHFFVPPVGAKVWIEFEAGDTGFPLWVGTWYVADDVPPEAAKDEATSRVVHTPSGHVIELADADGEEKVVIRHKLDSYLSIDKAGSVVIANQNGSLIYLNADQGELTVVSEHGHRVVLNGDGVAVTHSDGTFLNLTGSEAVLQASGKVQVMGGEVAITGGAVSIGAGAALHLAVAEKLAQQFALHFHPTAMGPSGFPAPPLLPAAIQSNAITVAP